jgi:hypothetical protein
MNTFSHTIVEIVEEKERKHWGGIWLLSHKKEIRGCSYGSFCVTLSSHGAFGRA